MSRRQMGRHRLFNSTPQNMCQFNAPQQLVVVLHMPIVGSLSQVKSVQCSHPEHLMNICAAP